METTKKQTKREITIEYFTKKSESVENYKDQILIFKYKSEKGLPCAAILRNREKKPSLHYQFRSESERVDFINRQKASADNDIEREAIRHAERMKEAEKFVKGAIVYDSWGWEQTNIDFYIILERVHNTITLQAIGENVEYTGWLQGTKTPDPTKLNGEPFKKRISKYGRIDIHPFSCTSLWDGTPKHFTAYA